MILFSSKIQRKRMNTEQSEIEQSLKSCSVSVNFATICKQDIEAS